MKQVRETHRGPVRDHYSVLDATAIMNSKAEAPVTWPYVCIHRFYATNYTENQLWYRHYAQPTLVLAMNDPSRLAATTRATMDHAVRVRHPNLFPRRVFLDTDAVIKLPTHQMQWAFLVMEDVHDLLDRQLTKLSARDRCALFAQLLEFVDTLSGEGTRLRDWDLGVWFASTGPQLKLLRIDTIKTDVEPLLRDVMRRKAIRLLLPIWRHTSERDHPVVSELIRNLLARTRITHAILQEAALQATSLY